jgi:signal transduction histidine kinase
MKIKLRKLVQSRMFLRVFLGSTLLILALFAAMYLFSVPFIQSVVEGLEERAARTVLDDVYKMVELIQHDLQDSRRRILQARKDELRHILSLAESRAAWLAQQVQEKKLSKEKARDMLLEELRHMQFGNKDYIWASDYHSRLVSHPDPQLNNADFSKQLDARGALIVPPMVAGALRDGEGYYSYWWRRLGEENQIEKLTFYRHLPSFSLVIGTGVYIDDVESDFRVKREAAIAELRKLLRSISLAETGYVYIMDGASNVLIHPNSNLENKSLAGRIDPVSQQPLFPLLKAAADKPEGLRYKWDKLSDPDNYVHAKISWVRYFKSFDWYICSSVYEEELGASARTLKTRLLLIFLVTLLVSIVLDYVLIRRWGDPLGQIISTARSIEKGNISARCTLQRNDEFGLVSGAINGMLDRLEDNIQNLDIHVKVRTKELEKANAELRELDQLKSDFISTVSHELRTPMTSIVGFAKLVKKKLDEQVFPKTSGDERTARVIAQVRDNLDIIVGESQRLTLLINDVLDCAKLDAGKVEWNIAPLAPAQLIERAVKVTAPLAEQKGLRLLWQAAGDLPLVAGDENRLLQVLINLVSNAIKFTEKGEVRITAQRRDPQVLFCVTDTGIGVAMEHQEKIFDKFRQIGDTLTDKPHGTGLGLTICQQIVKHHGGEIGLESQPGQGSVFKFTVRCT